MPPTDANTASAKTEASIDGPKTDEQRILVGLDSVASVFWIAPCVLGVVGTHVEGGQGLGPGAQLRAAQGAHPEKRLRSGDLQVRCLRASRRAVSRSIGRMGILAQSSAGRVSVADPGAYSLAFGAARGRWSVPGPARRPVSSHENQFACDDPLTAELRIHAAIARDSRSRLSGFARTGELSTFVISAIRPARIIFARPCERRLLFISPRIGKVGRERSLGKKRVLHLSPARSVSNRPSDSPPSATPAGNETVRRCQISSIQRTLRCLIQVGVALATRSGRQGKNFLSAPKGGG